MENFKITLAVCVIFSTVSMIALIFMAIRRYPQFNWPIHTLSNLGNPESGTASLFLNGAYILGGMGQLPLYIYFTVLSYQTRRIGVMIASPFLILMTIALAGLGLFSDHPSTVRVHLKFSIATFACYAFGVFFTSFTWFSSDGNVIFGILNLVYFSAMAFIWLISGSNKVPWSNQAIPEFVSIIIYCLTAFIYLAKIISA